MKRIISLNIDWSETNNVSGALRRDQANVRTAVDRYFHEALCVRLLIHHLEQEVEHKVIAPHVKSLWLMAEARLLLISSSDTACLKVGLEAVSDAWRREEIRIGH